MSLSIESVTGLRIQLWDAGFRCVEIYNPDVEKTDGGKAIEPTSRGKVPRGADWQKGAQADPPEAARRQAVPHALNTGIWCSGLRAIDIDVDNPTLAQACRAATVEMLGEAPIRIRRGSPRCTILYRAVEGEPLKRTLPGTSGKIEVLGKGQQFVAFGQHYTGAELEWFPDPPGQERFESLPAVTEAQIDALLDRLAPIIGAKPKQRANGKDHAPSEPQADFFRIASAVNAIPNDGPPDWETWNSRLMAIWAATGGTDAGKELARLWSARNPAHDADLFAERWAHYPESPPTKTGAGPLFIAARQAQEIPPPDEEPPPDEVPPALEVEDYAQPVTIPPDLPTIAVERGELNRLATDGELALAASGLPIFQRGGTLVRPISHEVPAAHGRATMAAGFQNITTPAMIDLLAQAATWVVLNRRRRKVVPTDPPALVASIILSRAGSWTVPSVAGIITTPTLRPGGSLLTDPGYDPATRLYHIADPSLADLTIPDEPTRVDAEAALKLLLDLLVGFPFNTAADRSVALSALITPVVRGALPVAPLHAIRASTAGTGKSYLVDLASAIATGRPCPVASASYREEETEKRIVGMILAGFPLVSIDNVNGALGSDLLCQVVERPLVRVRPLGGSEIIEIENRATFLATGNSLRVRGDMTRRTILSELDAGVERPELRIFTTRPVDTVLANRAAYVAAGITVCRAYLMARLPGRLDPLASFDQWSDLVRSSLVWLGQADPVNTMEIAREEDTEVIDMREIFTLWSSHVGTQTDTTALKIAEKACERTYGGAEGFVLPEFRDALLRIAGDRGQVNTRRLAGWIRAREGRIINGLRIKRQPTVSHEGAMQWRLIPAS